MTTTTKSVGEIMTKKIETIAISNSAQEAAKKMKDKNVSSLLVIDNNNNTNRPIGIVTERDLVRKVCVNDASSKHTMIQEVNKPLGIITPGDFTDYLKENLNIDDVNAKIIESIKEEQGEIK
jgi:CBS domain-containing protein